MVAAVLSMLWRCWCSASPGLAVSACGSRCHIWVRSLLDCGVAYDAVVLLVLCQSWTGCFSQCGSRCHIWVRSWHGCSGRCRGALGALPVPDWLFLHVAAAATWPGSWQVAVVLSMLWRFWCIASPDGLFLRLAAAVTLGCDLCMVAVVPSMPWCSGELCQSRIGRFYVWQPLSQMGEISAWLQWYFRGRGALGALPVPDWPFLRVAAAVTYECDLCLVRFRCRGARGALPVPDWLFLSGAAAVTYG